MGEPFEFGSSGGFYPLGASGRVAYDSPRASVASPEQVRSRPSHGSFGSYSRQPKNSPQPSLLEYREIGIGLKDGIIIYEVTLPCNTPGGIRQGFRAQTTLADGEMLEVVVNGPGRSKARDKIHRAIILASRDRSNYSICILGEKRHPHARPKRRKEKASSKGNHVPFSTSWRW